MSAQMSQADTRAALDRIDKATKGAASALYELYLAFRGLGLTPEQAEEKATNVIQSIQAWKDGL